MNNRNKDLFENKVYAGTPKYLYKVIKKCYYDTALNYGDLAFIYTLKPSVGTNNNRDLHENKSSCIVYSEEYTDENGELHKIEQSINYNKLCYCFTMNIHEYLSKNPLSSDDVVLRFNFEDVLKFFRFLPIRDFVHGKISYTESISELHFEISKRNKSKIDKSEEAAIKKLFKKEIKFMQECEYRFICSPLSHEYTLLYSLDLNMELSILSKEYIFCNSDSGYLIKFLPTTGSVYNAKFTVSNMVRKLFRSAKILE